MFRLRRFFQFAIGAIALVFACGFISVLFNGSDDATATPATRGESLAVVAATAVNAAIPATSTPLPTEAPAAQVEPPTATPEPAARAVLVQIATAAPVVEAPTAAPAMAGAATVAPAAAPATAANQDGNLRAGPGTEYEIAGSVVAGEPLQIAYKSPAGDWYQLGNGAWIAAFLVSGVSADLPVAPSLPAEPVAVVQPVVVEQPVAPIAEPAQSTGAAFACAGGCATPPDPSCAIKGNFDGSGGDKIFHQPGGRWYDRTDVVAAEGDVWFCTPDEAAGAGYREAGS